MQMSLDRAFQALGDPTRRRIVERLSQGPASVRELADPLPMSLSAVGQHLKILEEAGLVTSAKAGRVRTCRLDPAALAAAEAWLNQRRIEAERRFDRLADFLNETKEEGDES